MSYFQQAGTAMIELGGLITASLAGTLLGIIVGLVPGLSHGTTFLLMAPLLVAFHPVYGLFLFVALLVTSQYFGSITSLVYGVPGELSSYPVIAERSNLLSKIDSALKQTALGSFVASMFAVIVFVTLMSMGNFWVYIYNYRVFAWVLAMAVVATIMFGSRDNPIWLNAILFVIGLILAKIGFARLTGKSWGDMGIEALWQGIPLPAVALGLIVIPALWYSRDNIKIGDYTETNVTQPTAWPSIGRGSVLGIIGGLVPGVTYMASTQLSYFVENWITRHHQDRSMRSVVATSSADNAGATSSLYPLLWLGVPITLGEVMVVWLFDKQNTALNWSTLSQSVQGINLYWLLILCFVATNVLSYALSWPGRRLAIKLARHLLTDITRYIIIVFTLLGIFLLSQDESIDATVYWVVFLLSSSIGLWLKRIDWMPLIIGFILQDSIELTLLKIGILSI